MPAPDLVFEFLTVIFSLFISPPPKDMERDRARASSGGQSQVTYGTSRAEQYKNLYRETAARLRNAIQEKHALIQDRSGLESTCIKLQEHKRLLAKEVKRVKEKLDHLRLEQELQRQQLQNETLANANKVSDSVVEGKWKALDYNIRSLSYTLSKASPEGEFDKDIIPRLHFITPEYETLLQDENYRELVLQGYLWYLVDTEIFAGEGNVWAGGTGYHFKKTRRAMISQAKQTKDPEELQQLMRWFVTGSTLMENLWGIDEEALSKLVVQEVEYMQPFIQGQSMKPDALNKMVREQLVDILHASLELDEVIMGSKAILTATWTKHRPGNGPAVYDADIMDAVAFENDLDETSIVRFPVSPVLAKTGNANGSDYDRRIILAKGCVVCN